MTKNAMTNDVLESYKKVEERHTKDVENAYKLGKLDMLEALSKEFIILDWNDPFVLRNVTGIIDKYTKELQDSIVKVKK